jgi:rubrerythrin
MAGNPARLHTNEILADLRALRRFRIEPSKARPKKIFLNCHYCGYSPDAVPAGGSCPKCGGRSWERFALARPLIPRHMQ